MNTLGNTVGERINKFDNLSTQTVKTFNELFTECPIKNVPEDTVVEILSPAPNNCRELLLNNTDLITHKMFSDCLYNVDRDEYNNRHDEEDPTDILGVPCLE